MDKFESLVPQGISINCLEDLGCLKVKDLKKILAAYKEKVSGGKADLVSRVYAIFSRVTSHSAAISDVSISSVDDTLVNSFTYDAIFRSCCSRLTWTTDLRSTPPFTFIQLYDYLVIRTVKYKHILLKSTSYKKLNAFQFFYEGFIKKLEVATSGEFTYLNVRMKASMKSTLYKIIIKLCSSSGDVYLAAYTCPAGTGVGGNGNCNHVGGVLFALEDFNRNAFQDSLTPISCVHLNFQHGMFHEILVLILFQLMQLYLRKLNFEKIMEKNTSLSKICMTRVLLFTVKLITINYPN